MKRDFDLIRSILKQVEDAPAGNTIMTLSIANEISSEFLTEHIDLLIKGGFIEGEILSRSAPCFCIYRLTWSGQDFIDSMKDETIWNKAKETILKPVGGISVDILIEWLKVEIREKIGVS